MFPGSSHLLPCLAVCFESSLGTSTDSFNSWLGTGARAKDAVIPKLSPLQLVSRIREKKSLPVCVLQAAKLAVASVSQLQLPESAAFFLEVVFTPAVKLHL